MSQNDSESFRNHILILGTGDQTEGIIEALREDVNYLVIAADRDQLMGLTERGVEVLIGDPSDEEALRRGGIQSARAVIVAINNDAEDAMAVLTARDLNPDVRIVSTATNRQNVQKLKQAGADRVLSPAVIGARLLVRSAIDGGDINSILEEADWPNACSDRSDGKHRH